MMSLFEINPPSPKNNWCPVFKMNDLENTFIIIIYVQHCTNNILFYVQ